MDLHVEESKSLTDNTKNCIINIIRTIAEKDMDLIAAEDHLSSVADLLFKGSSSVREQSFSPLEEKSI